MPRSCQFWVFARNAVSPVCSCNCKDPDSVSKRQEHAKTVVTLPKRIFFPLVERTSLSFNASTICPAAEMPAHVDMKPWTVLGGSRGQIVRQRRRGGYLQALDIAGPVGSRLIKINRDQVCRGNNRLVSSSAGKRDSILSSWVVKSRGVQAL